MVFRDGVISKSDYIICRAYSREKGDKSFHEIKVTKIFKIKQWSKGIRNPLPPGFLLIFLPFRQFEEVHHIFKKGQKKLSPLTGPQ